MEKVRFSLTEPSNPHPLPKPPFICFLLSSQSICFYLLRHHSLPPNKSCSSTNLNLTNYPITACPTLAPISPQLRRIRDDAIIHNKIMHQPNY